MRVCDECGFDDATLRRCGACGCILCVGCWGEDDPDGDSICEECRIADDAWHEDFE